MAGRRVEPRLALGVAFVVASFAANSLMTRYVVDRHLLDPGLTTTVRFLAGAASLGLLLAATGGLRAARPRAGHIVPASFLGAYAFAISYGYLYIGAAAGTLVFYASVLATMAVGGAIRDRRAPRRPDVVGGLIALSGVAVLAFGRVEGTTLLGVALLAVTGASWGAYSLEGRGRPAPLVFTAANFFALALVLVPTLPLFAVRSGAVTAEGLLVALAMGAITTALSYAVWYWALGRITAMQGATFQLAIPILTALGGVVLLREPWGPRLFVAGAFVLAGIALSTRR
ncbi:MAG: EamA family transporter [Methanobacteriota archaeon]